MNDAERVKKLEQLIEQAKPLIECFQSVALTHKCREERDCYAWLVRYGLVWPGNGKGLEAQMSPEFCNDCMIYENKLREIKNRVMVFIDELNEALDKWKSEDKSFQEPEPPSPLAFLLSIYHRNRIGNYSPLYLRVSKDFYELVTEYALGNYRRKKFVNPELTVENFMFNTASVFFEYFDIPNRDIENGVNDRFVDATMETAIYLENKKNKGESCQTN